MTDPWHSKKLTKNSDAGRRPSRPPISSPIGGTATSPPTENENAVERWSKRVPQSPQTVTPRWTLPDLIWMTEEIPPTHLPTPRVPAKTGASLRRQQLRPDRRRATPDTTSRHSPYPDTSWKAAPFFCNCLLLCILMVSFLRYTHFSWHLVTFSAWITSSKFRPFWASFQLCTGIESLFERLGLIETHTNRTIYISVNRSKLKVPSEWWVSGGELLLLLKRKTSESGESVEESRLRGMIAKKTIYTGKTLQMIQMRVHKWRMKVQY